MSAKPIRRRGVLLAALLASTCAPSPDPAAVTPRPRSVIVIGIDTLRADHLGAYGHDRPTSPFLDRLARQGVLFEHASSTSPWTLPSFASLFTGRLQSGHAAGIVPRNSEVDWESERIGPLQRVMLAPEAPTIAGSLAGLGLRTLAVVQNPYLNPAFGIARGFEFYDYLAGGWQQSRRADEVVERSLAWIDEREPDPFFLFLHLFDPHMPYDPPGSVAGTFTEAIGGSGELPVDGHPQEIAERVEQLSPQQRAFIGAAYDEEILFVDQQLERFVAGLQERGLWDDALVILTSDHGEELFEHGGFEHGHTLYEELLHVPLIVWGPGLEGGRVEAPVSLADVAPTILEAFDLPVYPGVFGRSLWPLLRGEQDPFDRAMVAEGTLYGAERKSAILWPYKLIRNERNGRTELYDLERDPGERSPITDDPELVALLSGRLDEQLAASAAGISYEATELDPELQEQLRSLGYIR